MAISEFVDGTTPLDASHLNALVGGVNDLTDQVDELNSSLSNLGGRIVELNNYQAGTTYQITFIEGAVTNYPSVGIIYLRGTTGEENLTLFFNGYGYGSARMSTFELTKGSNVSYSKSSTDFAIQVTPSSANGAYRKFGYFSISGFIPTITAI